MSIQASELIWRKSVVVSNDGSNGGRMSNVQSVDAAKNNLFPDVSQADRDAGDVKDRKAFVLVNNSELVDNAPYPDLTGLSLISPRLYVEKISDGDDAVLFFAGTMRGTAAGITGTEQKYGAGLLAAPANAATSTLVVNVEDWTAGAIFTNTGAGSFIRVSDKTSIADQVGNEEFHTVTNVAPSGNQITLTISGTLANTYGAGSKVASVYQPADVAATVSAVNVPGGSGTIDGNYIVTDNTGTVSDDWTITFTSATAFTVTGLYSGAQVSGVIGSDYTATNPNSSTPYFFIGTGAWGGTFALNDTVTFKTDPAAIPIWVRRDVNAGATSISSNETIIVVDGESA